MPGLASAGSNAAHGKSEILNPKQETNPKFESQMFKTKQGPLESPMQGFLSFETGDPLEGWGVRRTNLVHLNIVSDFDIRISNFRLLRRRRLNLPELARPEDLQLFPVRFSDHLHLDLIDESLAGKRMIVIKNDPVWFLF